MDAPPTFPYRFNRFEPALFVEIYLPKKARYQGALYKSLRTGFSFCKVKAHLTKKSNFVHICDFLKDYDEIHDIYKNAIEKMDYTEITKRVDSMKQVFYGYSMYEVDGVFFNKIDFDKRANPQENESKYIAEENVQVIRMMFMPDMKGIFERAGVNLNVESEEYYEMRGFLKNALERQYEYKIKLEKERRRENQSQDQLNILRKKQAISSEIFEWINDVALFLFGFVIYNICQKIARLQKENERPEDEIWVTSFGNLEVNKITRL